LRIFFFYSKEDLKQTEINVYSTSTFQKTFLRQISVPGCSNYLKRKISFLIQDVFILLYLIVLGEPLQHY